MRPAASDAGDNARTTVLTADVGGDNTIRNGHYRERRSGDHPVRRSTSAQVATGDVYYPDVMVARGKAADVQYETDATIVIEVLSPTTRSQDRREKVRSYSTLPSITHYAVVEPDVRRIEVAHWDADRKLAWSTLGPGDQLHTPYGTWNVDDIYDIYDIYDAVDSLATT